MHASVPPGPRIEFINQLSIIAFHCRFGSGGYLLLCIMQSGVGVRRRRRPSFKRL